MAGALDPSRVDRFAARTASTLLSVCSPSVAAGGGGRLSYSDMQRALQSLGIGFSPQDLMTVIRLADKDGDGAISTEEFVDTSVCARCRLLFAHRIPHSCQLPPSPPLCRTLRRTLRTPRRNSNTLCQTCARAPRRCPCCCVLARSFHCPKYEPVAAKPQAQPLVRGSLQQVA